MILLKMNELLFSNEINQFNFNLYYIFKFKILYNYKFLRIY